MEEGHLPRYVSVLTGGDQSGCSCALGWTGRSLVHCPGDKDTAGSGPEAGGNENLSLFLGYCVHH